MTAPPKIISNSTSYPNANVPMHFKCVLLNSAQVHRHTVTYAAYVVYLDKSGTVIMRPKGF
jgi:hypothetical protein